MLKLEKSAIECNDIFPWQKKHGGDFPASHVWFLEGKPPLLLINLLNLLANLADPQFAGYPYIYICCVQVIVAYIWLILQGTLW